MSLLNPKLCQKFTFKLWTIKTVWIASSNYWNSSHLVLWMPHVLHVAGMSLPWTNKQCANRKQTILFGLKTSTQKSIYGKVDFALLKWEFSLHAPLFLLINQWHKITLSTVLSIYNVSVRRLVICFCHIVRLWTLCSSPAKWCMFYFLCWDNLGFIEHYSFSSEADQFVSDIMP